MKLLKTMKRKLKDEAGQALPMALVLLVLGGLLVVPTLSFMTTNLNANRIIEEKTEGISAADAGIQDALWKLGNDVVLFESSNSYVLPETVNGMTVTIEKENVVPVAEGDLYTLKSTATLNGEVKAVIRAQAVAGSSDWSWLFKHVLISEDDIEVGNHTIINGDILCDYFDGDPDQVYSGTITEDADVELPSPQMLIDYYMSTIDPVANNYTSNSIYISSSYTKANPYMIPPIYRQGSLRIYGNGYGKLDGNIYLAGASTGQLWIDPGTTIDLNKHTIFSEYYNNCSGDAINFQPNCYIFGPGCIIAIGNINYQPHLGTGAQLVGTTDDATEATAPSNTYVLSQFQATAGGTMSSFQVKCYIPDPEAPEAHVKVAIYNDDDNKSGGNPTTLRKTSSGTDCAIDGTDNITVISSWNPANFPENTIVNKNWYWLAAISDYPVISTKTVTSTTKNKYKTGTAFTGFEFPANYNATGFTTPSTTEYMLRGFSYSQEFIFLMSVKCGVNLQPHASFYGSIAGDSTIDLATHCTINLVGYDEGDLDFPSIGPSSGPSEGGNSPPLLNYNIE